MGGGTDEGIVNRLSYAAFHAAQAALFETGIQPSSHGVVRNRFGKEFVADGPVDREQGRLLSTLADHRQKADYGYEPLDVDVDRLLDRTESFVEMVADSLETAPNDR